jgi:hypothetical protein
METAGSRRSFFKIGLVGVAALAVIGGGYAVLHKDPGPGKYVLDDAAKQVFSALIPVILAGALPPEPQALQTAVQTALGRIQNAIGSLTLTSQQEVADLLKLLAAGPARRLLAGVDDDWHAAKPEQITAFLQKWRSHRSPTLQTGYQALHDLVIGPWYGDESTWAGIGYPGPIKELS